MNNVGSSEQLSPENSDFNSQDLFRKQANKPKEWFFLQCTREQGKDEGRHFLTDDVTVEFCCGH